MTPVIVLKLNVRDPNYFADRHLKFSFLKISCENIKMLFYPKKACKNISLAYPSVLNDKIKETIKRYSKTWIKWDLSQDVNPFPGHPRSNRQTLHLILHIFVADLLHIFHHICPTMPNRILVTVHFRNSIQSSIEDQHIDILFHHSLKCTFERSYLGLRNKNHQELYFSHRRKHNRHIILS